jgi:proteasome assembly chaperone (PAC2) family protein
MAVKMLKEPTLSNPCMFAAWPGMGNVALRAATYLQEQLKAELFAEIEVPHLFHFQGVYVRNQLIESVKLPRNAFYSFRNDGQGRDLLIFVADEQPAPGREWEYSDYVLRVAEKWGVKELFTAAAMPTAIDHKAARPVWCVPTCSDLAEKMNQYDVKMMEHGQISGMNGSLLGIAKGRGIEGACLLGEIPHYALQLENPKASRAILEVLAKATGITLDFTALDQLALYTELEIERYASQLSEHFKEASKEDEDDESPDHLH